MLRYTKPRHGCIQQVRVVRVYLKVRWGEGRRQSLWSYTRTCWPLYSSTSHSSCMRLPPRLVYMAAVYTHQIDNWTVPKITINYTIKVHVLTSFLHVYSATLAAKLLTKLDLTRKKLQSTCAGYVETITVIDRLCSIDDIIAIITAQRSYVLC